MCSHTYTCTSAHPLFHLNKLIKKFIKVFKSLLYAFSYLWTLKLHKINVDKALYRIKPHRNCIKILQNDQVQKDVKKRQNLTSKSNQKQQHFIPHASRSLLCIRFVAVAFRSEEKVLWRRAPHWPIMALSWIRPWADLAQKSIQMCGLMSTLSLPSLVNIHQVIL